MNVKKAVYDKCVSMVNREFRDAQHKLNMNRREINRLAKDQRVLKSEIGRLHELLKSFKK